MTDASARKRKVLIIDDDPDVLEYASVVFSDCGFDLMIRRPGEDLVAKLNQLPDLIVVDLLMPSEDGIQVLHNMAKADVKCPVLVVSMCSEEVLRSARAVAQMLNFEVLGFLRKPFYKEDVLRLTSSLRREEQGTAELRRLVNSGRIVNHYQPVVDVQRGRVIRLEALSRFHHPKSGIIAPMEFLRWSRRLRITAALERRLTKQALDDAKRIEEKGFRLPMSVNLSTETLEQPDFADRMEKLCRQQRFLLSQLTIEISENDLHRNLIPVQSNLTRLALRGCSVSLEYGGEVFSKMQLENLPLAEVKLTPSLVRDCIKDDSRRNLLISVVNHADVLDIPVTAIGVESPEELGLLLDLGLTRFQGHFFCEDKQFEGALYYLHRAPEQLAELGLAGPPSRASSIRP
ncbi:MAG: EAL domain-containing response regulator [Pseudomonadota bacterium]